MTVRAILVLSLVGFVGCTQPVKKADPIPVEKPSPEVRPTAAIDVVEPTIDEPPTIDRTRYDEQPFLLLDEPEGRGPKDMVIVAVGDVQQAGKQWKETTNQNAEKALEPTKPMVLTGDLSFMNLENPATELQPTASKTYAFSMPPERLAWYLGAGFNMFSLANNHIGDAGQQGVDDTITNLAKYSAAAGKTIYHAGAGQTSEEAVSPTIIKLPNKDLSVAFFSVGFGFGQLKTVAGYWDESLPKRIEEAKKTNDIVIVSVHAGKEYQHVPRDSEKTRYRGWVDAGADLVIGHHTHCVQPVEQYKQSLIFYSHGNYVFASRTVRHRKVGAKLYGMLSRIVIKDGKVYGAQIVPTWVNSSEAWKLKDGTTLANANFVPQILTGPFAAKFFEDFGSWTKQSGFAPVDIIGDTGFLKVTPQTEPIANN